MDKQYHLYSVDTSAFYNNEENKIHTRIKKRFLIRKNLKALFSKKNHTEDYKNKVGSLIKSINKNLEFNKKKLTIEFEKHKGVRNLIPEHLKARNIVSSFDSVLSRTLSIKQNDVTKDILIVQTYYFQILKDIIENGFMYNNEKYICFTASAGQIRTKKTVFIKESVFEEHKKSLMCGLTLEIINDLGGVNINKFLAYLALCNSATDHWTSFNIEKSIVVDDMETNVNALFDHIDDETYQISREKREVLINHTDGCGMMLPSVNDKSFMVRLPWIKGLLVPFPFDKFINDEKRKREKNDKKFWLIKDIYGQEHDVIKEGIEVIFTKSQFKMWKYYSNWEDYINKFQANNCQAGMCNEEEASIPETKINYQMLQTLTSFSNQQLNTLCQPTNDEITKIATDRKTMLKVLGVNDSRTNLNYYQSALKIYPELLADSYSKEILKQLKKKKVIEGRAGKLNIKGKYTFICPDLYAFCQFLFLGMEKPTGLLKEGEVYCSLYKEKSKLDCLRSPHLYKEHAVRYNVTDSRISKWFKTKGLYTSCHDPISKILMFDVDGDKCLVCADENIISVAELEMKDIVPLNYNMRKADPNQINNGAIYKGLKDAYTGGNIGIISNNITKVWNSKDINLDVIKILCMENNFTIDYAKTLYKPVRPPEIDTKIKKYTGNKNPYFFKYAKEKDDKDIEEINTNTVNRITKLIKNPRLNFNDEGLGLFNYRFLLSDPSNKEIHIDETIVNEYKRLDQKKKFIQMKPDEYDTTLDGAYIFDVIRNSILEINRDIHYVVDVLVEYLYNFKKSNFKTTLWSAFGDILLNNLSRNIEQRFEDGYIQCDSCGLRIIKQSNRQKMCKSCYSVSNRINAKNKKNK
ncbi:hypothetical protein EBB07_29440 [Paenibacillaceae bacterium]|nr:hypothetical protein EBB07_29440 [Paenibacillaceae bacterium]